jgi:hypothetical protein
MEMKRTFLSPGWIALLALLALLVYIGCKGDTGPAGPAGTNPPLPPVITSVIALPDSIGTGEYTTLVVTAYDPNGDAVTYVWSAEFGTLATPTAVSTRWTPVDSIGLYTINVAVTANGQTTDGNVVVGVNTYVPSVFPSYLGNDRATCGHCHSDKGAGWLTTPHSTAFANAFIGVEHKTTGYDLTVDNGGYDDNPGPWLENVQCEACHGPQGPDVGDHRHLSDGYQADNCGRCHAEYSEYVYSGHGTAIERNGGEEAFRAEWGGSSCNICHISEGFLTLWDPDWADRALPTTVNQIACGTCHDPHAVTDNEFQIRTQADFDLPYGGEENPGAYTVTGWAKGQLCGQCHHARRSRTQIMNQINNVDDGAQRMGPHDSPQADMISGRGSWEIAGMTYVRTNQHADNFAEGQPLEDVCVSCHMLDLSTPYAHSKHNFYPDVLNCYGCHGAPTNFNIEGVQTHTQVLLDSLATMLPHNDDLTLPSDARGSEWTPAMREAAYAWYFVHNDGSKGVHNKEYARTLLENAIASLQ